MEEKVKVNEYVRKDFTKSYQLNSKSKHQRQEGSSVSVISLRFRTKRCLVRKFPRSPLGGSCGPGSLRAQHPLPPPLLQGSWRVKGPVLVEGEEKREREKLIRLCMVYSLILETENVRPGRHFLSSAT